MSLTPRTSEFSISKRLKLKLVFDKVKTRQAPELVATRSLVFRPTAVSVIMPKAARSRSPSSRELSSLSPSTPTKKSKASKSPAADRRTTPSSSSPSPANFDGVSIAGVPPSTGNGGRRPADDPTPALEADASAIGTDDSSTALALVDSVAGDDALKDLLRTLISDKQKMQSSLQSLQHELTEAKTKADRREQVRAYEEGAPTGFSHDREVLRKGFMSLIFKHITDPVAREYWEQLDWAVAPREEVSRAFSLLVKMLRSARTSAFLTYQRDADCSMLPRVLSPEDLLMYKAEQKEKDKALAEWHTRFAPSLQVALHLMSASVKVHDFYEAGVVDPPVLEKAFMDLQAAADTFLQFFFELFGQHVAQPRRDLYEKATGLKPGQHSHPGFLTSVEATAAADWARQQDFLRLHSLAVQPSTSSQRGGRGRGKSGRGRGGKPSSSSFKHIQSTTAASTSGAASNAAPATSQDTPASSAANSRSPAKQSSTSTPKGGRGRGKGK